MESDYRVQSTDYGGKKKVAVQKCKTAYGLCKGAKVGAEEDYEVRSTEYGARAGAG